MKKILNAVWIVVCVCLLAALSACSAPAAENTAPISPAEPSPESSKIPERTVSSMASQIRYKSIDDWFSQSVDHIVIAKVEKSGPVQRLKESELYSASSGRESYTNVTPSVLSVEKSIYGPLKEGDSIELMQIGGVFIGKTENGVVEKVTMVSSPEKAPIEEGCEYLLFINDHEPEKSGYKYHYILASQTIGYAKLLEGGELEYNKDEYLFKGKNLDEALAVINESIEKVK